MATKTNRTVAHLDPLMLEALRSKSTTTSLSPSELANEAMRLSLAEDAADLAAFEERENEPIVSFEDVLKT